MRVHHVEVDQVSNFVVGFEVAAAVQLYGLVGLWDDVSVFGKVDKSVDLLKEVSDGRDGARGISWVGN